MKGVSRVLSLGFVLGGIFLAGKVYAQSGSYSQLVAKAQADLNAGNAAQALSESQLAIKAVPSRWEAYVVAGGALLLEQQYDKAIVDFSQAVANAPEAKKSAVRALLQKAEVAQSAAQPNGRITGSVNPSQPSPSGPSYTETIQWIAAHSGDAAQEGSQKTENDVTTINLPATVAIRIDQCDSLVELGKSGQSSIDSDNGKSSANSTETVTTIPFQAMGTFSGDANGVVWLKASNNGIRQETHSSDDIGPAVEVQFDPGNGGASFQDTFNRAMHSPHTPYYFTVPAGGKLNFLFFSKAGTQSEASHMANALNHLVEICKAHPEQVPKEPF